MSVPAERKTLTALIVSPAVAPAAVFVHALSSGVPIRDSLVMAAIYALFTYAGTVMLGLPAHLLLLKLGLRSSWYYAVTGVILGMLVPLPFLMGNRNTGAGLLSVAIFAAFGGVTAAVFGKLSQDMPRE